MVRPGRAARRVLLALSAHRGELIYESPGSPDGGLNLYAHHPELQMGPVSFLAAGLLNPFPEHVGQFLAAISRFGVGSGESRWRWSGGVLFRRWSVRCLWAGSVLS